MVGLGVELEYILRVGSGWMWRWDRWVRGVLDSDVTRWHTNQRRHVCLHRTPIVYRPFVKKPMR